MKEQRIDFVTTRREVFKDIEDESAFQVRKDRPFLWLQRLCFWFLSRLGAYRLDDRVEMRRVAFNADKFMERLFQQKETLAREFNYHPDRLLIGAGDFEELMHETEIYSPFTFNANYYQSRQVYGLKVTVVPWMRGVLVVPNEIF